MGDKAKTVRPAVDEPESGRNMQILGGYIACCWFSPYLLALSSCCLAYHMRLSNCYLIDCQWGFLSSLSSTTPYLTSLVFVVTYLCCFHFKRNT
ncbi:hypothetical protein B0T09DRAFT_162530 [Sordaria sp. MPI-SDFR-AT-0083]|nr:hypothetical protein B0T09DRAFT_162530 [Sordaria sp. MPI-SDFR-AT-0083]